MIHVAEFFKASPGNQHYRLHPLAVSRAAVRLPADAGGANLVPQVGLGADDYEKPGCRRRVLYEDQANDIRQELTIKLVEHNGGAWTNMDNVVRGVQSGITEGRFVVNDGTMTLAATVAVLVKGGLFAEYFDETFFRPSRQAPTPTPVTALANGDWYWVVVGGPYEYYAGGACAVGTALGLGAVGAPGQLEDHAAVVGAGTDKAVGWCLTDPGVADVFGTCRLELDRIGDVDSLEF